MFHANDEGDERVNLTRLARELGLGDRVLLPGDPGRALHLIDREIDWAIKHRLVELDGAVGKNFRKALDAVGDLYLLGYPIRGKVTAHLTGHRDNIALLREIVAGR